MYAEKRIITITDVLEAAEKRKMEIETELAAEKQKLQNLIDLESSYQKESEKRKRDGKPKAVIQYEEMVAEKSKDHSQRFGKDVPKYEQQSPSPIPSKITKKSSSPSSVKKLETEEEEIRISKGF